MPPAREGESTEEQLKNLRDAVEGQEAQEAGAAGLCKTLHTMTADLSRAPPAGGGREGSAASADRLRIVRSLTPSAKSPVESPPVTRLTPSELDRPADIGDETPDALNVAVYAFYVLGVKQGVPKQGLPALRQLRTRRRRRRLLIALFSAAAVGSVVEAAPQPPLLPGVRVLPLLRLQNISWAVPPGLGAAGR